MMKFGYTIIYSPDVPASLAFFEEAFGFKQTFLVESNDYGELDTGSTVLAFASISLGESHFPQGFVAAHSSQKPLGIEIAFITENVLESHNHAVAAGAMSLKAPGLMPWGQTVSYLRCPDGTLVELCSPIVKPD